MNAGVSQLPQDSEKWEPPTIMQITWSKPLASGKIAYSFTNHHTYLHQNTKIIWSDRALPCFSTVPESPTFPNYDKRLVSNIHCAKPPNSGWPSNCCPRYEGAGPPTHDGGVGVWFIVLYLFGVRWPSGEGRQDTAKKERGGEQEIGCGRGGGRGGGGPQGGRGGTASPGEVAKKSKN